MLFLHKTRVKPTIKKENGDFEVKLLFFSKFALMFVGKNILYELAMKSKKKVPSFFLIVLFLFTFLGSFYAQESNDEYVLKKQDEIVKIGPDRFRIGANFGRGFRLAKVQDNLPPALQNYANELKKGFTFGLDASYLIGKSIGFGLKYNRFKAKNKLDNITVFSPNGQVFSGATSDDIGISFIGVSLYTRAFSKSFNNNFFTAFSLGKLSYVNNAVFIERFKLEGSSFGFVADVGYEIQLDKNISLGFLISFTLGSVSEFTVTHSRGRQQVKAPNGEAESLSRIDLSIGIRFHR